MAWTIEFDEQAQRDLARLDKPVQREIARYLDDRIAPAVDPKAFGHHSVTTSPASGVIVSGTTASSARSTTKDSSYSSLPLDIAARFINNRSECAQLPRSRLEALGEIRNTEKFLEDHGR